MPLSRGPRIQFTAVGAAIRGPDINALVNELSQHTRLYAERLRDEIEQYPSPVSGSSYIRTYRLLRSWRINNIGTGGNVVYQLSNQARDRWGRYYAQLVHGGGSAGAYGGQRLLHRTHGWKNIGEVVEASGGREQLRAEQQAIINKYLVFSEA